MFNGIKYTYLKRLWYGGGRVVSVRIHVTPLFPIRNLRKAVFPVTLSSLTVIPTQVEGAFYHPISSVVTNWCVDPQTVFADVILL